MSIQFILIVAVLVAALVAGLVFLRRLTEGGMRHAPEGTPDRAQRRLRAANASRDNIVRLQSEASMPSFIKVIAWSLAGAIIGGALMFIGLLAFGQLFEASKDNAVRGFQTGQA